MSDFTSGAWSWFIIIATLVSIAACLVLLFVVAAKKVQVRSDNTTGHVWDEDLVELNHPMPMWWMGLFVITVIFSFAYLYFYPGLGSVQGSFDWSSKEQHKQEMQEGGKAMALVYAQYQGKNTEQLAADPQAMAIANRLFLNNCAQCHGSDARGSKGFPNLTDNDWLWGGTPDKIQETIVKGRNGVMPPMAAAVGNSDDVRNLAEYVLSLSGYPSDSIRAGLGKSKFSACAACHGVTGKGNVALGAPNLSDDVWLHGWGKEFIVNMINNGRTGMMPAQKDRLTDEQIGLLTAYVWGMSNKPTSAGK
ncbi:cytochrome-c oxidase, cbb3-type subunit III [Variovorax sp. PCZ-1]|uniref:cytochrome-c oxidase, cbb3-type subunit III n=1 Tax=Variovorax sp. PCZ-1 TaxID=2835533 RepID=UPI001BD19D69|nr:cytochrome-c oxidase, cbb3-type subunit III [Variovorax sp. PCZ-1]MBS7807715.1 cytochrome-c oxidase, cbb3-type subunit III [Variovorax sp. PCZ-1]